MDSDTVLGIDRLPRRLAVIEEREDPVAWCGNYPTWRRWARLVTAASRFVVACAGLRIVTVKVPVAVLPDASLAEQLTVVEPSANVEPEVGKQLTSRGPSTRSVAEAVP